ncbi:unnamed protein product [Scytosiphon promiscuus]
MPLTMRPIPHALNLGAPEIYGQGPSGQGTEGTQVLEDVNMASMVGTLAQLGALATYAQDMFDGLFQTADGLASQISAASDRCSRLLKALPEGERRTAEAIGNGTGIDDNAAVEAIKADRQHAAQMESEAAAKVFLPEAMPRWLVERYHSPEVARVPELYLIDAVLSSDEKRLLAKDGLDSCALRYSNPQFFYQEWYRLELERQEKSVREKKQKKEERKRRKAAAKAAAGARAVGEQDEDVSRAPRPARKSLSDWRGKFANAGLGMGSGGRAGLPRAASARNSAGDVSSLVGSERVVVQKREAYGEKFYRQEEDFADTGYQVAPSDTGPGPAHPSGMQQLGALTAEDFNRKLGSANEDGRRLFKPQSAFAAESSASQPPPPRPQQRPPPPQTPAAEPGTGNTPQAMLLPQGNLWQPIVDSVQEADAIMDGAPPRPSYETWGIDQPAPAQPTEELGYSVPPVAPPAPPPPTQMSTASEASSKPPPPPPLPPSRPPATLPVSVAGEALCYIMRRKAPFGPQRLRSPHPPPPPPLPAAPFGASGGGASVRGALLASITDGKKLKKVATPTPSVGDGGGGGGNELLDAIRYGAQLKQVERPEPPVAETSNPLFGGNPGINEILARRKYLEAESEDSDSDEDSDWDDD